MKLSTFFVYGVSLLSVVTSFAEPAQTTNGKTAVVFLENRLASLAKQPCFTAWQQQLQEEGLDLDVKVVDPFITTDVYKRTINAAGSNVVGSIILGDIALPTAQMTVYKDDWRTPEVAQIQTVLPIMNPSNDLSNEVVDRGFYQNLTLWNGIISQGNHEKPLKERVAEYCEYFKRDVEYRTCSHSDHLKVVGYVDQVWKTVPDLNSVYSLSSDTTMLANLEDIKRQRADKKEYDFGYIASHSSPYMHFPSGVNPISDQIIQYWNPPVKFYDLYACSAGNYSNWPNLAQTYLFSKSALGVFASTKTGSINNPSKLYQRLRDGETFGDALVHYQKNRLGSENSNISDLSWIAGEVFYGDPTLKLYHCDLNR